MNSSFLLSLSLFLLALIVRTSYELLKKAGKVNPKNKILFSIIFTSMCVLWASWFSMCPSDPTSLTIPYPIRFIGLALVLLGFGLAVGALVQLRGLENIDHLVTSGLFSFIRHPMYTGFILWIVGWAIYHGAQASFLVGLAGIANILFWRHLEENKLESNYGEEYRQYRELTWF